MGGAVICHFLQRFVIFMIDCSSWKYFSPKPATESFWSKRNAFKTKTVHRMLSRLLQPVERVQAELNLRNASLSLNFINERASIRSSLINYATADASTRLMRKSKFQSFRHRATMFGFLSAYSFKYFHFGRVSRFEVYKNNWLEVLISSRHDFVFYWTKVWYF